MYIDFVFFLYFYYLFLGLGSFWGGEANVAKRVCEKCKVSYEMRKVGVRMKKKTQRNRM